MALGTSVQDMKSFSMIEVIVVVGLMAVLASFTALSINHGPGQKQLEESGRQLSRYLKSLISEASSSGIVMTLYVDFEKGKFSHMSPETSSKLLNQIDLPEGVTIAQMIGVEGTDYLEDSSIAEISLHPKGLEESLQIRLNYQDLNDVILTWKLKGQICSVETEREGVDLEHWKDEVTRF
jgi:type II secretory pathway pseudopilin PulG